MLTPEDNNLIESCEGPKQVRKVISSLQNKHLPLGAYTFFLLPKGKSLTLFHH